MQISYQIINKVTTLLLSSVLSCSCFAAYPDKPITLVVPFAPGGGTDSIARDLAKSLTESLGQTIIVDNRGGGGGAIGAGLVSKAPADGYTLLFVTSTFVTHAATDASLSYKVDKDFSPIAMIGRGPLMIVSSNTLHVKSIADLIKVANENPEGINYCSAGSGSINHLAGELFKQKTNIKMTHIPYKGSGPAVVDLLGGRVQVFFATVPTMLQYVESGRVTLLAMTSEKRSPLFPATPTAIESGLSGFAISTWWGVVAPPGTPLEIVNRLNAEIQLASRKDPLKSRLSNEGAQPYSSSPQETQKLISTELKMWQDVAKSGGIKID
jgi:tripartite-type tricarboxylate transporter receptor subunit TctC